MPIDTAALAASLTAIFEDIDPDATAEDKAALIAGAIEDAHTDGGGGGGGAVDSVNGHTGVVVLDFADVGADEDGAAAAAQAAAEAASATYTDTEVAAEATARASADSALTTSLSAEAGTRATADTALSASIAAEATTRASEDTFLASLITAEASARTSADVTLAAADATESAARAAADALLIPRATLTAEEDLLIYRGGGVARLAKGGSRGMVPMINDAGLIAWTALSLSLVLCGEPCIGPGGQQGSVARAT